jgi:hypothetical protein
MMHLLAPTRGPDVRLPAHDWILLLAILVAGMAAGTMTMGILYLLTPIVALLAYHEAVRHARHLAADEDLAAPASLPSRAYRAVDRAAAELPHGEARSLLASVVKQAGLLFEAHALSSDRTADRATLGDVAELVEAACVTALELARLDAATGGPRSRTSTADERQVRDRFTTSLTEAAHVIRRLHLAKVGGGTVASDRVAELTAELRDDASARARAMAELAQLLERSVSKGSE